MITIEEIESIFLSYGYELEEKEYRGYSYKYKIKDVDGYLYRSTYSNLKEGYSPNKFHSSNPFTIYNIDKWLQLVHHPYRLSDREYKDNKTLMTWIDRLSEDKIYRATWNQIYAGSLSRVDANKKIAEAHKNKSKSTGACITEEITRTLKEKFPEWSFDGDINALYKGVDKKIPIINKNGYKSEVSSSSLKAGYAPSLFLNGNTGIKTFNMYKKVCEDTKYILKENQEFKSMSDSYVFICSSHGEFTKTLSFIVTSMGYCPHCLQDRMRGENHPSWERGKLKEERIRERKSIEYKTWRDSVFERDEFQCVVCSQKGGEIHAHHRDGYHWCENRRYDVSNGVTLCMYCHRMYHSEYGTHNTRESEWMEWESSMLDLIKYNKRDFDKLKSTFIEKEMEIKTKRKPNKEEGVGWREDIKKWRLRIKVQGKWKGFGNFDTEEEAINAKYVKIEELKRKGVL